MSDSANLAVLTICGSLRRGSYNAALARALPALAPRDMTITAAPSFSGFPLYNADLQASDGFPDDVMALGAAVREADGVIFVSPEYNFSIPGALKNAIDWISRLEDQPLRNKPVALQSASPSPLGGARMQYHLRQVMVFVEAITFTRPEIFVMGAPGKFGEDGALTDETTRELVAKQLAVFGDFIRRVGAT
ncbi:MAG: NADPH-dependent FMN reductase [Azospirillaceae bacterium]